MAYTVKVVADLADVSVRTLHHRLSRLIRSVDSNIGSEAFEESIRRTKKYTEADWAAMKEEGRLIYEGIAVPSDPAVQEWVRRHHKLINDRFYPYSAEVYRGLGDLYVQDDRFTATYENMKPGMASFMRAAMHAYCNKSGQRLQGNR
jgi:hypothetical protein